MDSEERAKQQRQEREALQVALQDVVREFQDEGVISKCLLVMEIADKDGGKHLSTRTFDLNGDTLSRWDARGFAQTILDDALSQEVVTDIRDAYE